jgi:hypothetical protein
MRTTTFFLALSITLGMCGQTVKGRIYSDRPVVILTPTDSVTMHLFSNGRYKIKAQEGKPLTLVFVGAGYRMKTLTIPGELMQGPRILMDVTMEAGENTEAHLTEDEYGFLRIVNDKLIPATSLW